MFSRRLMQYNSSSLDTLTMTLCAAFDSSVYIDGNNCVRHLTRGLDIQTPLIPLSTCSRTTFIAFKPNRRRLQFLQLYRDFEEQNVS